MLRILLAKDLRRIRRNPFPVLINLAIPLCITALIGLAFGGKSDSGSLGRIRFAVVDEDDSVLTQFLRGGMNQGGGGKYLAPVFMDRDAALREIQKNDLSAVLIIPTNFTRNYLTGRERVSLELIKNPAQSIHPAVLEELLGAVTTSLNAIARNFQSEFPKFQAVIEGKENYRAVSAEIERMGDKLQTVKKYVDPPIVTYEREVRSAEQKESKSGPAFNLFGYLLAGLAAMFLLFLAGNGLNDLHREIRIRTFERYHTLHPQLTVFVASKIILAVVILLLSSAILLGLGGMIFRIRWENPLALVSLTLAYSLFAAALMAVLVALIPDERRANALTSIAGMALGIAGGCAFPPQQLPAFMRDHIATLLPTYWFAETLRNVEFGDASVSWLLVFLKLVALSVLLVAVAAFLFRRQFKSGLRP